MNASRRVVSFINIAHAIDHMAILIFPTAVLAMEAEFGMGYAALLPLSIGGFIAFGAGSIPSGWAGDRWSRRGMMAVFFIGIGLAMTVTGFATSPWALAAGITLIGAFASIYHPVGTAMLTAHAEKVGQAIGINGVWGNLGVAAAALTTGAITQWIGWRWAFVIPGVLTVLVGLAFIVMVPETAAKPKAAARASAPPPRAVVIRAFAVLILVTIAGGVTFNATTVTLPKVFDERLTTLAATPLGVGGFAALVFVIGATAQVIMGRLVDRYPLKTIFVPLAALQGPCLLLAAFATDYAMLALAIGMMFAIFGQVTINDAMVARYTADEWRARAYAFRYLMSFSASACAVPMVALLHGRAGGFDLVFIVLGVFGAIVFLGALLFPLRPEEVARPVPAAG